MTLKAKIDSDGNLSIRRRSGFVDAFCHGQRTGDLCDHWCPQFGEPYEWGYDKDGQPRMRLEICQGQKFEIVEDARPQVEG